MNSLRLTKLASILSTLTAAAALALTGTGCVVSGGVDVDPGVVVVDDTPPPAAIAEISVDPGATMSARPGDGVGVFVQYDEGGHWSIFTTCDTSITGTSCNFDILVSADPGVVIDNVEGTDLEVGDSVTLGNDGSINLVTDTAYGTQGLSFDADPGATVELDVLLDGVAQPDYVFVVSDGRLLSGVPSNPVDFFPAAP